MKESMKDKIIFDKECKRVLSVRLRISTTDVEAPILELWDVKSTLSLPLLPGSL